jgi:hypothetical protein
MNFQRITPPQLLIVCAIITLFSSCSQISEERNNQRIESDYIKSADLFLTKMIEADNTQEVSEVSNITIDSIVDLSERMEAIVLLRPLQYEVARAIEFAQSLTEIKDMAGIEYDKLTRDAIDDAMALDDSLKRSIANASDLSDEIIVGTQVHFKVDMTLSNGTKNKALPFVLNFDLDNDLPEKWNSLK